MGNENETKNSRFHWTDSYILEVICRVKLYTNSLSLSLSHTLSIYLYLSPLHLSLLQFIFLSVLICLSAPQFFFYWSTCSSFTAYPCLSAYRFIYLFTSIYFCHPSYQSLLFHLHIIYKYLNNPSTIVTPRK